MRSGSELPQHLFPSRILIILHLSTLQGANGVIMRSAGSNRSWGGRPTPRLRGAGDSGLRPLALAIRPLSDLLEANRQWCPSEEWRQGVVGQMLQCRQITGALVIQSRNQEARLQSRLCPQHGVLKARTQTANIGAQCLGTSPGSPREKTRGSLVQECLATPGAWPMGRSSSHPTHQLPALCIPGGPCLKS